MVNVLLLFAPKVIDAQAAATVTVTVRPPSIVTVSPATGTLAPEAPPEVADHVLVAFQLPVATEKRAFAAMLGDAHSASRRRAAPKDGTKRFTGTASHLPCHRREKSLKHQTVSMPGAAHEAPSARAQLVHWRNLYNLIPHPKIQDSIIRHIVQKAMILFEHFPGRCTCWHRTAIDIPQRVFAPVEKPQTVLR
jgi:hypothetical protein